MAAARLLIPDTVALCLPLATAPGAYLAIAILVLARAPAAALAHAVQLRT
jgi:hypothetical protein